MDRVKLDDIKVGSRIRAKTFMGREYTGTVVNIDIDKDLGEVFIDYQVDGSEDQKFAYLNQVIKILPDEPSND